MTDKYLRIVNGKARDFDTLHLVEYKSEIWKPKQDIILKDYKIEFGSNGHLRITGLRRGAVFNEPPFADCAEIRQIRTKMYGREAEDDCFEDFRVYEPMGWFKKDKVTTIRVLKYGWIYYKIWHEFEMNASPNVPYIIEDRTK